MTIATAGDTFTYDTTTGGVIKATAQLVVALDAAGAPAGSLAGSGITANASFTPAVASYGAGSIIDVAKEFAFTYANGVAIPAGSLIRILTTVVKIDATAVISGETSYTLQTYSVTPPSAQADQATWSRASADLPSSRGGIPLGTPVDEGASLFIRTPAQNFDAKLTTSSLWGRLVTAGAFTGAAVARQVFLYGIVL